MNSYDKKLRELQEQTVYKKRLESKLAELRKQRETLQEQVRRLTRETAREEQDVEKLEGYSLSAFYYAVIGKKGEKLDKEKAEAYAARVKLNTAKAELDRIEEEIGTIQAVLSPLMGCEQEYRKTLEEKCRQIRLSGSLTAEEIFRTEERIGYLEGQRKEIKEAVAAGRNALRTTENICASLKNAQSWSTWDMIGGSLWTDMAKHSELDDAQRQVKELQTDLRRFQTELADIQISADLTVRIDGFLRFADWFFDGFFVDWTVMSKINDSQRETEKIKSQVERVLNHLSMMDKKLVSEIENQRNRLEQLVLEL